MWTTEHRNGFLMAVSKATRSVRKAFCGSYDMVVVSSSWDRRSISITESNCLECKTGVVFLYTDRDDIGLRDKHDSILRQFVAAHSHDVIEIEGASEDLDVLWSKLAHILLAQYKAVGRPLKVFIDLSTCPRYYSLGILSFGIRSGIVRHLTYGYAEGLYPTESDEHDRHEMFTRGGWNAVPVPSLEGEWNPDKDLMYLVSVGFEGSKTHRLVSRAEPDRVSVLFPDPPVKEGYVERTMQNNRVFFEQFGVEQTDIIRARAGDAVEAWSAVATANPERFLDENCIAICCGTKPHSLALALRAITKPNMALLYIVPDRHRVVDVSASGIYWRYDIRDASAIVTDPK